MKNYYTAIIFSFLLLLGNAPISQALMTGNEVESSAKFFRESAQPRHGEATYPPKKGNRTQFVNTSCSFGLNNQEIFSHRGSGR
ncbi:hypothetical protein [Okeania sp.]|uniref:hypothetical protein n=1 Tax=Okeania sp. TaxID=3100323 RepID=UPI002B4B1353|nr:hypothetical protein [Okeania sp.]MEB3343295.1 hypothetical protein [Okeania sp.]